MRALCALRALRALSEPRALCALRALRALSEPRALRAEGAEGAARAEHR